MASGGFDVVLGNPPWERIKLQEKEWFSERRPEIANAPNANGNQVPKLPRWQGSLRAGYSFGLGAARLMAQIEYIYRGSFQYRIFNDGALDSVPSYDQWNLYVQLAPPGSHWRYSLGVSNLFNIAGINARYTDPYGTGQTSDEFIPPRQLIGTVAYHF